MVHMISDLLGKPSSWFAADGRDTPPIMSAERIRELRGLGIDFRITWRRPSQTRTAEHRAHPRRRAPLEGRTGGRARRSGAPLLLPLRQSRPPRRRCGRRRGYASATTCVRSPATPADDPLTLPRKAISWGDNLLGYFWRLHMKNTPKTEPIRRSGRDFADALTRA